MPNVALQLYWHWINELSVSCCKKNTQFQRRKELLFFCEKVLAKIQLMVYFSHIARKRDEGQAWQYLTERSNREGSGWGDRI